MKRRWISLLLTGTLAVGLYWLEDVDPVGAMKPTIRFPTG